MAHGRPCNFMNQDHSSYEGDLPNKIPAAPRSISIEEADKDSAVGRNNVPYNPGGGQSNMRGSDRTETSVDD